MKKLLTISLALLLAFASMLTFVSCGGNEISADSISLGSVTDLPSDQYSKFENEFVSFYYPSSWYFDSTMNGCTVVDLSTGSAISALLPYGEKATPDAFIESIRSKLISSSPFDDATVGEAVLLVTNVYSIELSSGGQVANQYVIISVDDEGFVDYYLELGCSSKGDTEQFITVMNSISFKN